MLKNRLYGSILLEVDGNIMMRLKGLRDIKTHGILARAGRLVSVARDLHSLGGKENTPHSNDWNSEWNLERHIFKKKKPANAATTGRFNYGLEFAKKIRLHQIEVIQDVLVELRQAMAEGLPVAQHEFERLKTRLAELQIE